VVLGCASTHLITDSGHLVIPFRIIGSGIPVIRATINDKEAWFIIDTGASATLVNMSMARYFGLTDHTDLQKGELEINGLGGVVSFRASTCKIGIGPLVVRHRVLRSAHLDGLFSTICNSEKISIGGILGTDLLMQYHISVNYDTRTISCRITNEVSRLLVAK
jgi:hypothetical protein